MATGDASGNHYARGWSRELAAEYVAAVAQMKVGDSDYLGRVSGIAHTIGKSLSARSKDAYLNASRRFFADAQEWDRITRRFNPFGACNTAIHQGAHRSRAPCHCGRSVVKASMGWTEPDDRGPITTSATGSVSMSSSISVRISWPVHDATSTYPRNLSEGISSPQSRYGPYAAGNTLDGR